MKQKSFLLILVFGIILLFNSNVLSRTIIVVPISPNVDLIKNALDVAVYGDTVEVNPGLYYETQWLGVNNGVTLKLLAGVTVNVITGFIVEKGGTLKTCGTLATKVYLNFGHSLGMGCYGKLDCTNTIFANYSMGSTWDGIWLMGENGDMTSGSKLDSCIITGVHYSYNGEGAALWILGSHDVTVRYCIISNLAGNNTTGIYVEGSYNIQIYKNKLQNNRDGLVGNFGSRIYFGPILGNLDLDCYNGNNIITGNSDAGILSHHRTYLYLYPPYNYNNISGNVRLDAEAYDSSGIYAMENYLGGINPPNIQYDPTSYIYYLPTLSCAPVLNLSTGVIEKNNPINISGMLNKATNALSEDELLQKAFELLASENYTEALNIFKSIVSTSKDNGAVYGQALGGISIISKITGDKGLLEYLKGENKNAIAKLVYASTLVGFGSYDEAISEYEAIAKSYPGTNHEIQALVKISYTYLLYKKDLVKAEEILDKVTKVAGSKIDPKYGYYKDEDLSVRFLRGMVAKQTYGNGWTNGDRLTYIMSLLMSAKEYTELVNLSKLIISKFKTDPNSVAGAGYAYNEALSSIAHLYGLARNENFAKNYGLDSKELFEYLKAHTKDDENATPWHRVIYAEVLPVEEAILEYEEILKMLGDDAYGISLKLAILEHIRLIYVGLNNPYRVRETEDRINQLKGVVSVDEPAELPTDYSLSQNYPNPFNPTTTIQYSIPKDEYVKLVVYDVTGKVVKELVNGYKSAGRYNVEFNASGYASSIYYYRLEAGAFKSVQKMMLLK